MSNVASTLLLFLTTMLPVSTTILPVSATMSNEISSFRQCQNKSNMFNLFRLCRKDEISYDIVAETGYIVAKTAIMSKQHSTLSKGRHFTIESFDIVAVCGNKVERCIDNVACCFDIVAGVDGVLVTTTYQQLPHAKRRLNDSLRVI